MYLIITYIGYSKDFYPPESTLNYSTSSSTGETLQEQYVIPRTGPSHRAEGDSIETAHFLSKYQHKVSHWQTQTFASEGLFCG